MAIKRILGGKSKNLFDISKADVVINANNSRTVEMLLIFIGWPSGRMLQ